MILMLLPLWQLHHKLVDLSIDEVEGMTLSTAGNGWLCARINTADADATAPITFTVNVSYDV